MRVILASILSAVALFFFGFLWWALLMGVVKPAKVITDPSLIGQIDDSLSDSDLYIFPDYAAEEHETEGSMALVFYNREMASMGPMMGWGFAHMFVTALLVSIFVSLMPCPTFAGRFGAVFFLGLFVAVWDDIGNMIWWQFPTFWSMYNFGYDILSWVIAGAIIAAIVKRKPETDL